MGDRAEVDPRPGGQFTIQVGSRRAQGRYLEIDRPRRLVITWGRAGSKTFPPDSSVLEVTFTSDDGGTLAAIRHSGLPDSERHRHALGWQHYLARLSLASAGQHLPPHATPDELSSNSQDLWIKIFQAAASPAVRRDRTVVPVGWFVI